nr:uncharacterized protein LOC112030984 [Quercus suber]
MAKIIVLCCLIILAAFRSVNAQKIGFYELQKGNITLKFTNWGAAIVSVILPDRNGKLADVALGFDSIQEYEVRDFGSYISCNVLYIFSF